MIKLSDEYHLDEINYLFHSLCGDEGYCARPAYVKTTLWGDKDYWCSKCIKSPSEEVIKKYKFICSVL